MTTSRDDGSFCSDLCELSIHNVFWKVAQVVNLALELDLALMSCQDGIVFVSYQSSRPKLSVIGYSSKSAFCLFSFLL